MSGSEKDKMLAGELYRASDPQLVRERALSNAPAGLQHAAGRGRAADRPSRAARGDRGRGSFIQPPFACDYGSNVTIGENDFINFNAVVLDCAAVTMGDGTQIGPGVQLLAADHPRDAETRRDLLELAHPISIGANVWIDGAAVVLLGVSVGDDSIVGAGSVVTRNVPSGVLALGNPCQVVREL